jgi:hypothetical protein
MANTDSSEIVSHLRTVHFSLVLACILALLSLIGSSPSVVQTAHNQLQKILSIKANWNTWTQKFGTEQITWLKEQGLAWPHTVRSEIYILPAELKRENLPDSDQGWEIRPLYSPIYFYVSVDGRHEILGHGFLRDYGVEIISGGYDLVGNPLLNTLEDFRHFWDRANSAIAVIVTELSQVAYFILDDAVKAELRWSSGPKLHQGAPVSLGRIALGLREQEKCPKKIHELLSSQWGGKFNELFCGTARRQHQFLVLPARYREQELPTNLRVWLAKEFNFPTVGGKFEESFQELNEITRHYYQKLELNNANQLLKAELQRAGERVEFLGLKFPERVISTWGAFIIVIIQLYFWLHLRVFRARLSPNSPAFNVAWIGLYADPWARLISLSSVSVFPLGVIFYLTAWSNRLSWASALLVPGLLLSYRLSRYLWQIQRSNQEGQ